MFKFWRISQLHLIGRWKTLWQSTEPSMPLSKKMKLPSYKNSIKEMRKQA